MNTIKLMKISDHNRYIVAECKSATHVLVNVGETFDVFPITPAIQAWIDQNATPNVASLPVEGFPMGELQEASPELKEIPQYPQVRGQAQPQTPHGSWY